MKKIKFKLKKFFKRDIWLHLIIIATISFFAFIFNKPVEAMLFCVSHIVIRPQFEKEYHNNITAICTIITLSVAMLGIYTCLPLSVSLLSAAPVACAICWVGYLVEDRIEAKRQLKKFTKSIWTMNEEELRRYCQLKGIFNQRQDFVCYVILEHLTFTEIADKLGYSVLTIKDWSKICKKKLNIIDWQP